MTIESSIMIFGLAAISIIIILSLFIILPIKMAKKRGRSAIGWVLFFWFFTPITGIIVLLIVGDSQEKIHNDIVDELNRH